MSRIGKTPILIPQDVEIKIEGERVFIKGPKGEVVYEIPENFVLEKRENVISVVPKKMSKKTKSLWGTTRAILSNYIKGVKEGFEKKLEIRGIGYKASLEDEKTLVLEVGYSHPVKIKVPQQIEVKVEKNIITVSGIDKQKVGEFAAKIRAVRKPEPYKGKGIRYLGEHVRKKEGKKAATTTG